ncbi:cholesterol 25-hydroxylase-like protein [Hyperolius riggenbachi]|uniref:cholesterol 25-hydroxylase-like protein n=1 Tax=Hyperolius riggenbachi TaxID=752182 RepID=UPI0035A36514
MNSSSVQISLSSLPSWGTEQAGSLFLQPLWDFVRSQEHIRSPFYPAMFSFIVYMAFCLPYMALDFLCLRIPALKKYQVQPKSRPTLGMVLHCLAHTIYSHLVFIFPLTVAYWYWRPVQLPTLAPGLHRFILDIIACLLLFDFQYFTWHLLHHKIPWLYKTFHKMHHKYTATFALSTQYSSAWEMLSLGFFANVSPVMMGCHPMTEMAVFIIHIYLSVEDHCGYDLPWATHKLVPFGLCGGPTHHDLHHEKFVWNYAPYFTHWDKLFSTLAKQTSKESRD